MRVMVVDDNVDSADTLAEILRMMGNDVVVANDGTRALQLAGEAEALPDLVLLDIGLPGMDGYETARAWRARFGATGKLVALTGYGGPEDKQRAVQAGFAEHLVKPVDFERLEGLLAASGESAH